MTLTPTQVYAYARAAGFPPDTARKMVAIAQRESSLNPNVIGTLKAAKETSYGLWQINLKEAGIKALMARNRIMADNIRDPQINARAAYLLWGGSDSNLNTAWYINRPGYQEAYQQYIPSVMAAIGQGTGDGTGLDSSTVTMAGIGSSPSTLMLLGVATLAGILILSR